MNFDWTRTSARGAELARAAQAAQHAEALRQERDDLIRQAISEGWTHQQIADVTGLTRGRIGQIARN